MRLSSTSDQVFEAAKVNPSLPIPAYLSDVLPRGWYAAYVTAGDVMRSNPKLLQDAVAALVEANRFIYKNRDRAIEIGVKYTQFDRDIVTRTYDVLAARRIWPVDGGTRGGSDRGSVCAPTRTSGRKGGAA